MLNASDIRIAAALIASMAVHGLLLSLDTGMRHDHSRRAQSRTVTFRLVAPQPEKARKEVAEKIKMKEPEVVRKDKPVPPGAVRKKPPGAEEEVRLSPPVMEPEKVRVEDTVRTAPEAADIKPEPDLPRQDVRETASMVPLEPEDPGLLDMVMARPLYRVNPPPPYPVKARRRNLQGTVILEVTVSSTGKVDQLQVRESCGHRILDNAALAAVQKWVFEPGSRNGVPVSMTVLVPVRFSLQQ